MNRRTWAGVMAAGWLFACGEEAPPIQPPLRPVRFQEVTASGDRRVRSFTGVSQAGTESPLSFRVPGTVEGLAVVVGDPVRAGQRLARLDDSDLRLQAQEAEAAVAAAEAALRNAEAIYQRAQGLYESESVSRAELDSARAAAESARAQVAAAEQRLGLARSQLSYAELRAPLDGVVAAVRIEENQNVQAGQTAVVVTSGSRLEVEVAVPESLITEVEPRQQVEVRFDARPGEAYPAKVTEVGVTATLSGAAYPVTVTLETDDPGLRPGMAAEVAFRFAVEGGGERILVPPVAVGEDRQGRFVFVLEAADGGAAVARRRGVRVGELTSEGLEVVDGLGVGELLVTAGVRRIEDGRRVRLAEDPVEGSER